MRFFAYLSPSGELMLFDKEQTLAGSNPAKFLGIVRLTMFDQNTGNEVAVDDLLSGEAKG